MARQMRQFLVHSVLQSRERYGISSPQSSHGKADLYALGSPVSNGCMSPTFLSVQLPGLLAFFNARSASLRSMAARAGIGGVAVQNDLSLPFQSQQGAILFVPCLSRLGSFDTTPLRRGTFLFAPMKRSMRARTCGRVSRDLPLPKGVVTGREVEALCLWVRRKRLREARKRRRDESSPAGDDRERASFERCFM